MSHSSMTNSVMSAAKQHMEHKRFKARKLDDLARESGYGGPTAMLEAEGFDSVVPAICMNDDCDYTTGMEPDQTEGWCEVCETNTVMSCLVLAGVI